MDSRKRESEASACRLLAVSRARTTSAAWGCEQWACIVPVRQLALHLHSFWQMPWWVCHCFQYMYIWAAPLGFREGGARRNALGTCWRRAE